MAGYDRRHFLKASAKTLMGITLGSAALRSFAQEQLQASDPTAEALKYTPKSPQANAICGNCMYIQGKEGEQYRPCAIFPGKLVNKDGWCTAWVKRPG
ncbi:high-potential iron-sulfur protein [Alteromonas sp. ASW11-130]|uniref:high-potential iron-sulfur protein n=1 Tax=Alteromonas sp. ASW11-130 TaxID=3015775 RepID=UPI002241D687|nr:high-potential iron-sulfur protein [Alteromonas sp. ASW11-130]MCW8093250.1 high-potential iron-sulfur protein [Alteromonas sp. ASW11-130]